MSGRLLPQPDEIQRELRIVLRQGLRPARVERCLDRLPALTQLAAFQVEDDLRYDIAIKICDAVQQAVNAFGDGPFGRALQDLFGLRAGSRGLNLDKRRSAAADTLDREVATIARHWEKEALLDLAVQIYSAASQARLEQQ